MCQTESFIGQDQLSQFLVEFFAVWPLVRNDRRAEQHGHGLPDVKILDYLV